jgi:pimeloyl-ACP methyl ester carboxylesterase
MQWIDVNGVSLRYELAGTGAKTIVLVHEMGGSLETWDDMFPTLAKRWRVLRYDTREAGFSEKTGRVPVIGTMVDDIAALLDALEISAPVAIVGCAVGAAIAMHFAARHPQRSAALMAMSPATGVAPNCGQRPWRARTKLSGRGCAPLLMRCSIWLIQPSCAAIMSVIELHGQGCWACTPRASQSFIVCWRTLI